MVIKGMSASRYWLKSILAGILLGIVSGLNGEDNFEETARLLLNARELSQPRMSPNGHYLAMIEANEGGTALLIKGLAGGDTQRIDLLKPLRLKGYDWSGDSQKLVYFVEGKGPVGESSGELQIYSLKTKKTETATLPELKAKKSDETATMIRYYWVDFFRENREMGLLMTTTQDQLYTYRYDWSKGGKGKLLDVLEDDAVTVFRTAKEGVSRVQVNSKLVDNVFKSVRKQSIADDRVLYRINPKKEAWTEIAIFGTKVGQVEDVYKNRYLVGLSYSGDQLYYVKGEGGARGVYIYDLESGTEKGIVYETSRFDSIVIKNEGGFYGSGSDLVYSQKGQKEVGLMVNLGYESIAWVDDGFKAIQSKVDQLLAGRINVITDWDDREERFLVSSWISGGQERFYLFEVSRGTVLEVGARFPGLTEWSWGNTHVLEIPRRDGSSLIAYLDVPAGKDLKTVPVILDLSRRLDGTVSLKRKIRHDYLLAQGYGILRMPLSGSPGQGRIQFERGYGRSWEPMVEDIEDAAHYLLENKQVDPRKLHLYASMNSVPAGLLALQGNPALFGKAFLENPEIEIDRIMQRRSGVGNKRLVTRWNGYAMLLPEQSAGEVDYKTLNVLPLLGYFETKVFIYENPKGAYRNLKQSEVLKARLDRLEVGVQYDASESELKRFVALGRFFDGK